MDLRYGDAAARALAAGLPSENKARAVATSIGAYTASNGTLTANANGALAAQDGVTMAVGDVLFLPEGLTNVTAADAGPYSIVALGGASAKVVLARPSWWKHAALIRQGVDVAIGPEGTLYGGSSWKSFVATAIKVIGTDAPALYPRRISKKVTLAIGTLAAPITNIPVRGVAGQTEVRVQSLPSTAPHANTRVWRCSALTAGVIGTASIQVVAESAPGTTNASDVGDYDLIVENV